VKAALALLVAVATAACVLLAVRPGTPHEATSVRATVTPASARFGDTVIARIELRGRVRGARVDASFAPFDVVGTSHTAGAWTFTLRCTALACLTSGHTVPVQLPPARLTLGGRSAPVSWPPITLGSRLSAADLTRPAFRADTAPPAPRYRFDPVVAGWALAGLAAALVLGGGIRAATLLRRRRPQLELVEDDRFLTPLERALAALERSLSESVARRRIALDAVALLLDEPELAQRARRLGWSPSRPGRAEIAQLLADCRQEEAAA
jgi:hypothetical protein